MRQIIAKLNEVFVEDTTNEDPLVFVNHVLMGKLMASETLRQQAAHSRLWEALRDGPGATAGPR